MSASALYEGWVVHRRLAPPRRFRYPVWMTLLDMDELPEALDRHPLWSARRPAPVRVRARDFLPGDGPLADRARSVAAEQLGVAAPGPVRLLASPRVLGIGFNPVSFAYVHEEDGSPAAVIAEVTNTPWGERHRYVAPWEPGAHVARAAFAKRMHVSPFMPMEQTYELEAGAPGERLGIAIASRQDGRLVFEARLELRRRELTRGLMTRMLVRYPSSGAATLTRIYARALRMWLGGVRHHPHPRQRTEPERDA
ncbi:MAG TPA: DUF1365 domain-containing protein [Solirubrobacterales bacterium]|nr:DUF1365 domain-containing protein [Solirubrobacterales bacterium]